MSAKLSQDVKYCLRCGRLLIRAKRIGRIRPVCENCGWIYFSDPKVAVAAVITRDEKILLVRRANDPQRGKWTLPAGFVDAGEDPKEALIRECREETELRVRIIGLVDVLAGQEHPHGAHILIVYRAEVLTGDPNPGDDVDRVSYFSRDQLPTLAFTTTDKILENLWK